MSAPPASTRVRDLSLYIHFPFCEHKCPYCDFNSHERANIPEGAYVAAVLWRLQSLGSDTAIESLASDTAIQSDLRLVRSIFFGGGTPSLLSARAVETILEGANANFRIAPDCEITLEANPSSAERAKLGEWKKAGINRISLGVQSFDDDALRFLGRVHDARQARDALEEVARLFTRFSFDLITALPCQSDKALKRELSHATAFAAPHLCVYQLTIEKATAFYRARARGALTLPSHARAAHLYRLAEQELAAQGYEKLRNLLLRARTRGAIAPQSRLLAERRLAGHRTGRARTNHPLKPTRNTHRHDGNARSRPMAEASSVARRTHRKKESSSRQRRSYKSAS